MDSYRLVEGRTWDPAQIFPFFAQDPWVTAGIYAEEVDGFKVWNETPPRIGSGMNIYTLVELAILMNKSKASWNSAEFILVFQGASGVHA